MHDASNSAALPNNVLPPLNCNISALPACIVTGCVDAHAGTYQGLVEKLDYLQRLGINAIELQPVQEFNELEYYEVGLRSIVIPQMSQSNGGAV